MCVSCVQKIYKDFEIRFDSIIILRCAQELEILTSYKSVVMIMLLSILNLHMKTGKNLSEA